METEVQLIGKRASLHWLAHQHPDWTQHDLASALGQSLAWVKKWLTRSHHSTRLHRVADYGGAAHSGDS